MKRLVEKNINTSNEYNRIFQERQQKGIDEVDLKRWHLLLKYFKGGRFIELGCLDSLTPAIAKKRFPKSEVWGLDQAEKAVIEMTIKYPNIRYVKGDVYTTEFPSNYFDYVVAGELIEHLEEPQKFIKEAIRILKAGGCLALSTPKEEEKEPGAIDGERHLWSFTRQDIKDFLAPCGRYKTWIFHRRSFPNYKYFWPIILSWAWKR